MNRVRKCNFRPRYRRGKPPRYYCQHCRRWSFTAVDEVVDIKKDGAWIGSCPAGLLEDIRNMPKFASVKNYGIIGVRDGKKL